MRSNLWFTLWASLEINILAFLSILAILKSTKSKKPKTFYYFIPQACGSLLLVLPMAAIITSPVSLKILFHSGLTMGLCIKAGMPPFHGWFISLTPLVSKWTFFLLSTLQKIMPLYFIQLLNSRFLPAIILFSTLLTSVARLLTHNTQLLLAWSSIFTASWILSTERFTLRAAYIIFYALGISLILLSSGTFSENFSHKEKLNKLQTIIFMAGALSIAGVPPFTTFFTKLLILQRLVNSEFLILALVLASIVWIYRYLKLILNYSTHISSPQILFHCMKLPYKSTLILLMLLLAPLTQVL